MRRQKIIEILCIRRGETLDNLSHELQVSKRTIQYDIEFLSADYPIYTKPGLGGGIYITDKYRFGQKLLEVSEELCLEKLLLTADDEDKEILNRILDRFSLKRMKR